MRDSLKNIAQKLKMPSLYILAIWGAIALIISIFLIIEGYFGTPETHVETVTTDFMTISHTDRGRFSFQVNETLVAGVLALIGTVWMIFELRNQIHVQTEQLEEYRKEKEAQIFYARAIIAQISSELMPLLDMVTIFKISYDKTHNDPSGWTDVMDSVNRESEFNNLKNSLSYIDLSGFQNAVRYSSGTETKLILYFLNWYQVHLSRFDTKPFGEILYKDVGDTILLKSVLTVILSNCRQGIMSDRDGFELSYDYLQKKFYGICRTLMNEWIENNQSDLNKYIEDDYLKTELERLFT